MHRTFYLIMCLVRSGQDENAVKYELAPRGTIDGYLGDDDRVRFSARKQ